MAKKTETNAGGGEAEKVAAHPKMNLDERRKTLVALIAKLKAKADPRGGLPSALQTEWDRANNELRQINDEIKRRATTVTRSGT